MLVMTKPQGLNFVYSPYLIVHWEDAHVEPPGHTRHVAPHALLFDVVSVHVPVQHFTLGQLVPLLTLPVKLQTDWPVLHEVLPFWQTLPPGLQAAFAVQAMQLPM